MNSEIRKDFPMLGGTSLIYFDNACTTLKPQQVIDAEMEYYSKYSGCAGRSAHHVAKKTDEEFELARHNIANFVNANEEELIFTRNTTEALNLVANSFEMPQGRDEIVTTIMEHHSAYVPFFEKSRKEKLKLNIVKETDAIEEWKEKITKKTGIVVVHAVNNTIGSEPPLRKIVKFAHDNGAVVLVDGAQSVPHSITDFKKNNLDFLAFSGHKMLGPTGIGALVVKKELLTKLKPFMVGGGTIEEVKLDKVKYLEGPHRFEAGIQNYAGAIGFSSAVNYLKKIGMSRIEEYEKRLIVEMEKRSNEIAKLTIYGNFKDKKSAIFTFNINGVKPHQVTIMLDKMKKICTRSGVFCAQPAMDYLGAGNGAVRASLYFYNTMEELDVFFKSVDEIAKTLGS
ncbi:MAG: cysteine desulfurase [Candidatus Micrarchaeota archaeon]|nr:cysteine desulfurase [Candidatus Micrarchaeota archaeon]